MLNQIGRICVKIAGRDAGKECVIVDILDDNYVLIDGAPRRRKCNISHLEPTKKILELKKNADHKTIEALFKENNLDFRTETKKKTIAAKLKKQHINRKTSK
jgi:large subunit ribosomal protein L14e